MNCLIRFGCLLSIVAFATLSASAQIDPKLKNNEILSLIKNDSLANSGKSPLYMVNNVEVDSATLNSIDSKFISKVEIIRPGNLALEKYGPKAQNGVYLIFVGERKEKVGFKVYQRN